MEVELLIQQGPSTTKALPVLLAQTQKKKHIAVTIVKLKKNAQKKQYGNKKDGHWWKIPSVFKPVDSSP